MDWFVGGGVGGGDGGGEGWPWGDEGEGEGEGEGGGEGGVWEIVRETGIVMLDAEGGWGEVEVDLLVRGDRVTCLLFSAEWWVGLLAPAALVPVPCYPGSPRVFSAGSARL